MDGVPLAIAASYPQTFGALLEHERAARGVGYTRLYEEFCEFCESRGVRPPQRRESMYQWCRDERVPSDAWRVLLFDFFGWGSGTIALAAHLIGRRAAATMGG